MEFILERAYFEEGTNGALFCSGKLLCFTIELPWRDNRRNVSCIPEGVYQVEPRYSKRFQHHLWVQDVKNRNLILIHPANDALKELEGCIAPVTTLNGIGKGSQSRPMLQKLLSLVYQAQERKETILLIIKGPSLILPKREEI